MTALLSRRSGIGRLLGLQFVLLSPIAVTMIAFSYVPTFGWDVLDFWAPRVIFEETDAVRHSSLIPDLVRFILFSCGPQSASVLLSVVLPLVVALLVYHVLALMRVSIAVRVIFAYVALTIPLVENHAAIRGYSELWVVLALLIGVAGYLRLLEARGSKLLALLMCSTVFVIPALRSSGATVLACFLTAVLVCGGWAYVKSRLGYRFGILGVGMLLILALLLLFPDFQVYQAHDGLRVVSMGYDLILTVNDPIAVAQSIAQAWFVNSSFTVTYTAFFLVLLSLLWHLFFCELGSDGSKHQNCVRAFLFCLSILLGLRIVLAQMTTHYVFSTSQPGSDMLGSREFMVGTMIALLAVASTFRPGFDALRPRL